MKKQKDADESCSHEEKGHTRVEFYEINEAVVGKCKLCKQRIPLSHPDYQKHLDAMLRGGKIEK
jgi:hypothetical protein